MLGFGSGKNRTNRRLLEAHDAISKDVDRLSAEISQADGHRTVLIKRAATSASHEQRRIASTVRQLDRDQERRRQRLMDLQRQQNLLVERMGQLEADKTDGHRKKLDKLMGGDLDDFVLEAEERALEQEEDRAYLQDIDEGLDATVADTSALDDRTSSIMDEINVQKELMEDERSGKIRARLKDRENKQVTRQRSESQQETQGEETY
jgi:Mg2+ and Co2+ transporter CorA